MPMYEYTCSKCDEQFEKLVKSMNDTNAIECPACHSTETARAISVFAVAGESSKSAPAPATGCGRCSMPGGCGMG